MNCMLTITACFNVYIKYIFTTQLHAHLHANVTWNEMRQQRKVISNILIILLTS